MIRDDAGDSCLTRICCEKSPANEIHSAQGEITHWPHAQMVLTCTTKCALCATEARANFGEIKRPIGMCRQKLFEFCNDCILPATAGRELKVGTFCKAPYHKMDQLLLERAADFWQLDKFRSVVGQLSDHPVQFQQT